MSERGTVSADERIVPGTAHWDTSYPDHIQRYRFAIGFLAPGDVVLDAGCGVGYGSAELADAGASRVVAIDIADDALELARTHFDRGNITWQRDDCHVLEHAARLGPFDLVTNFENIEHLPRPQEFVARVPALLAPHGTFITSTPNRALLNRLRGVALDAPSSNPHHLNEFDADEFRALLESHFRSVHLWYQVPTGASGRLLAVRLLAARLGLIPLLRSARRAVRALFQRSSAAGKSVPGRYTAARLVDWHIRESAPAFDTAWTIIAVCREAHRHAG